MKALSWILFLVLALTACQKRRLVTAAGDQEVEAASPEDASNGDDTPHAPSPNYCAAEDIMICAHAKTADPHGTIRFKACAVPGSSAAAPSIVRNATVALDARELALAVAYFSQRDHGKGRREVVSFCHPRDGEIELTVTGSDCKERLVYLKAQLAATQGDLETQQRVAREYELTAAACE